MEVNFPGRLSKERPRRRGDNLCRISPARLHSAASTMSSSKNHQEPGRDRSLRQTRPRTLAKTLVIVLAVGALAAAAIWLPRGRKAEAPSPEPPADAQATNAPAPVAEARPEFQKLKGKWLRPDGGYVVEVRSIEAGGKMDVGYFNPQPINVSRAAALQDGATTRVFIELRDTGYPGCMYTLAYDPQTDQLQGVYFQAAMQQNFDVVFERMK